MQIIVLCKEGSNNIETHGGLEYELQFIDMKHFKQTRAYFEDFEVALENAVDMCENSEWYAEEQLYEKTCEEHDQIIYIRRFYNDVFAIVNSHGESIDLPEYKPEVNLNQKKYILSGIIYKREQLYFANILSSRNQWYNLENREHINDMSLHYKEHTDVYALLYEVSEEKGKCERFATSVASVFKLSEEERWDAVSKDAVEV